MPESQARPIITVVQHKSGMWARSLNQAEREMFERLQCALASCQFTCMAPQLQSTITCPNCGYQATEVMPTDACVALYEPAYRVRRVGLLILQNRRDSLQLIIVALALTIASRMTKGSRPRHVGTR